MNVISGDWQWEDSGICDSYIRNSPKARREVKKDAGVH